MVLNVLEDLLKRSAFGRSVRQTYFPMARLALFEIAAFALRNRTYLKSSSDLYVIQLKQYFSS
jgi:hypothetical protein